MAYCCSGGLGQTKKAHSNDDYKGDENYVGFK